VPAGLPLLIILTAGADCTEGCQVMFKSPQTTSFLASGLPRMFSILQRCPVPSSTRVGQWLGTE
jgi:hypothetical protein